MKRCKTCHKLKTEKEHFRRIERPGRIVPYEGKEEVYVRYYWFNTCKECEARKQRFRKGKQTTRDIAEGILIMLKEDGMLIYKKW